MKKKQAETPELIGEGILTPYLGTGEQIISGEMPVLCAKSLSADEKEAAEQILAFSGEGGCAVRIFGRGTAEKKQISLFRAVYRACAVCPVIAVIPAVVLPSETEQVRRWAYDARSSLLGENISPGKLRAGIAVETPSAAILADLLAPMVDFFVLSPSKLIEALGVAHSMQKSQILPESVTRCMKMTCAAARREGISVLLEND